MERPDDKRCLVGIVGLSTTPLPPFVVSSFSPLPRGDILNKEVKCSHDFLIEDNEDEVIEMQPKQYYVSMMVIKQQPVKKCNDLIVHVVPMQYKPNSSVVMDDVNNEALPLSYEEEKIIANNEKSSACEKRSGSIIKHQASLTMCALIQNKAKSIEAKKIKWKGTLEICFETKIVSCVIKDWFLSDADGDQDELPASLRHDSAIDCCTDLNIATAVGLKRKAMLPKIPIWSYISVKVRRVFERDKDNWWSSHVLVGLLCCWFCLLYCCLSCENFMYLSTFCVIILPLVNWYSMSGSDWSEKCQFSYMLPSILSLNYDPEPPWWHNF